SWRQSKMEQASLYNAKAEEIARKTDDRVLLASALLSKANIFSWRGHTALAINTYSTYLDFEKYIVPRTLGSIYSNLGGVLYESGDLQKGKKYILNSIEIFNKCGKPINLSIAHCHLAIVYLQTGQTELATRSILTSIDFAN